MGNCFGKKNEPFDEVSNHIYIQKMLWDVKSYKDLITLRKLGQGSWGKCYLVKDVNNNRKYVHKIPRTIEDKKDVFFGWNLACSLNHPNIIRGVWGYHNQAIYQYHEGYKSIYQCTREFTEKNILRIVKCILSALSYMHSRNIIHGDIRTTNVIVSMNNDDAKIIDLDTCCVNNGINYPIDTKYPFAPFSILCKQTDYWMIGSLILETLQISPDFIDTINCSQNMKNFIRFVMTLKAIDLGMIFSHPWIKGE